MRARVQAVAASVRAPMRAHVRILAVPTIVLAALALVAACGGGSGGGAGATVRLAMIADYGVEGPDADAVAGLVAGWSPDAVVTAGDNNYPAGAAATIDRAVGSRYAAFIGSYRGGFGPGSAVNRFFPTLGNHDWEAPGARPHLDYFTLPGNERYYEVAFGPLRVFAIDSDPREPDGVDAGSVQARWLRERLAAAAEPWRIVVFHHAPYGASRHAPARWMRWPFRAWGADAVVAGHNHVYERVMREGLPYLTIGLGGAEPYALAEPAAAGTVARWASGSGALLVTADRDRLELAFIAVGGGVIDRLVLSRSTRLGAAAMLAR